jgi:hypothetical protein
LDDPGRRGNAEYLNEVRHVVSKAGRTSSFAWDDGVLVGEGCIGCDRRKQNGYEKDKPEFHPVALSVDFVKYSTHLLEQGRQGEMRVGKELGADI